MTLNKVTNEHNIAMPVPLPAIASRTHYPADFDVTRETSTASRADRGAATLKDILGTVNHPDLDKYLMQTGSGAINYAHVLEKFQRSKEFKPFSNEMIECLSRLHRGQYGGVASHGYVRLIDRLELRQPRAGGGHYGAMPLFQLYQEACLFFKQIDALLRYAVQNPAHVPLNAAGLYQPLMANLEAELEICGPGLLQKTDEIATSLKHALFPPKLSERVMTKQIETAKQVILDAVAKFSTEFVNYEGNEKHIVKTWMDEFAPRLGLTANNSHDIFANKEVYYESVAPDFRDKVFAKIQRLITLPNIVGLIAQEGLELAQELCANSSSGNKNAPPLAIDSVLHQLAPQYGEVPAPAIFRWDEISTQRLQANPTLMVAHLLTQLRNNNKNPALEPELQVRKVEINTPYPSRICQWGQWTWIEHGSGNNNSWELLTLEDLDEDQIKHVCIELKKHQAGNPTLALTDIKNFLIEMLRNEHAFEKALQGTLNNNLSDNELLSAALICARTGLKDAHKTLSTLEPLVEDHTISTESLLRAAASLGFEDSRPILKAFDTIMESGNPDFGLDRFQETILHTIEKTHHEELVVYLLKQQEPESEAMSEAFKKCITENRADRLGLLLDRLPCNTRKAKDITTQLIQQHATQIKDSKVLAEVLKHSPILSQEVEGYCNALDFWLITKKDEHALQVLNAWVDKGHGDYLNDFEEHPIEIAAGSLKLKVLGKMLERKDLFQLQAPENILEAALCLAIKNSKLQQADLKELISVSSLLLTKGANPEGVEGNRPLLAVISSQYSESDKIKLIDVLLKSGAKDAIDKTGLNAVDTCCMLLLPKVLEKLLEHPSVFRPGKRSLAVLMNSSLTPEDIATEEYLEHQINWRLKILKQLQPHGLNLYTQVQGNITALEMAATHGNMAFAIRALAQDKNLNALDDDGLNKLHHAVIDNKLEVVEALVRAGANIHARSGFKHVGKTPAHYAVRNRNPAMIDLLSRLGANLKVRDLKSRRAQDYKPTPRTRS